VNAAATCGDWHEQSNYGDRWSSASTWWEYSCTYSRDECGGRGCCRGGGGACEPDGYYETLSTWIDYYVWDGTNAVFYGEAYNVWFVDAYDGYSYTEQYDWWDAATAQWYDLLPAITSFTPAGGPVGTVVDIRGSNFSRATSVTFSPGTSANYTVDSNSEIHATVPAGATSGPISITTLDVDGSAVSSATFTLTP